MRCFVAVDIPEDLRKSLADFVLPMRNLSRGIKWVAAGNIHLTLKFLGEVAPTHLPKIADALATIAPRHRAFPMTLRDVGAFPSFKRPQVLWIGLERSDGLAHLAREIDLALHPLGFPREEREFSPHLTIGRVRDRQGVEKVVDECSARSDVVFGTINVTQFSLKESVLRPAGPLYRDLFVFTLSRRNDHE